MFFRVDTRLKQMSDQMEAVVDCVTNGMQSCTRPPPCSGDRNGHFVLDPLSSLGSAKALKYDFLDRERRAVSKIEHWWHQRFIRPQIRFRLKVLSTWSMMQHPHFDPDKAFECTAYRPFQDPGKRRSLRKSRKSVAHGGNESSAGAVG